MFKTTARWAWLGLMTPMGCAPEHADPLQAPGGGFDVGTGSAVWATVATPPAREGKRRDRVLVDPVDDDALREICAEHGVMTLQAPGRSGVAAIGVPASLSAAEFTALLSEDDRVDCVFEESWVSGATTGGALSWHLDAIGADGETPDGLDDVVVAVIDSGVAWSGEGSVGAVAAGSLSANPIASPWDFVEGDAHPQDEHQHGTHIASLIGSDGVVDGVAPGVGLMPLRVLDRNNQGTELDLVEAILWATDRGADVINLSVSFWPGYQPTLPLMMALDRAADAGVLVVAAAGNDGLDGVTWPAASPRVLAVGAVCSTADGRLERAPYSNHGAEVDLVAPGGCLDRDVDEDGLVDGVAGETVHARQEGTGVYLWSGTSQAAAVASGVAARLVAEGIAPGAAGAVMVQEADAAGLADAGQGGIPWLSGLGAGALTVPQGIHPEVAQPDRPLASVLPYLRSEADVWTPAARVSVVDVDGVGVQGAEVAVRADGDTGVVTAVCVTAADGGCEVQWSTLATAAEPDAALQWTVTVLGVVDGHRELHRPGAWVRATGGLEVVLDAANATAELEDTLLAWRWSDGADPVFGDLAEAWAFVDLSSGVTRPPSAVLATPSAVGAHGTGEDRVLDLDGSGLATSPMGLLPWTRLTLDPLGGSGLATSPMGVVPVDVVGIRASDFLASAGEHPSDVHDLGGSGLATSPLGIESGPVDLGSATELGWTAESRVLLDRLDSGGLRAGVDWPAPEALVAVGLSMEPGWRGLEAGDPSAPRQVEVSP